MLFDFIEKCTALNIYIGSQIWDLGEKMKSDYVYISQTPYLTDVYIHVYTVYNISVIHYEPVNPRVGF